MQKFINHLNCFNLNPSQYWLVPDIYQRADYEISWFRTMTGNPIWKVKKKGEPGGDWEEFSNKEVLSKLSDKGVDLVELQRQISEAVLRQAVYATQIADSARELLGDDVLDRAVSENEILVAELVTKIKQTLEQNKSKHLKLIQD